MRALIAIDDSSFSKVVVDEVLNRIWNDGSELLVLNVVALPEQERWLDWGLPVEPALRENLVHDAETLVSQTVARLKNHLPSNIKVDGKVSQGHACDGILAAAKDWNADIILVGSHGRQGLEKFLLGSVAEGVLLRAPCTVELIRAQQMKQPEPPKKKRVVVLY